MDGTWLSDVPLIYINEIGENITSNLRLFADNSLLYLAVETPQDALILQDNLDKLTGTLGI